MRRVDPPELSDDLSMAGLMAAIKTEIAFLEAKPNSLEFNFGDQHFTQLEYLESLKSFVRIREQSGTDLMFFELIKKSFDFYEVYGERRWGEVLITSYYEPVIQGSLKKSVQFDTPLYKIPHDIVSLDLNEFDPKYSSERKLRGRLQDKKFVPYYSREEIDTQGALQRRNLEICWVSAIDAYDLQVQGSGTVDLGHGKFLYLNYGDKNGHRFLTDDMNKLIKTNLPANTSYSLPVVETFFKSLPRPELQKYLNMNPSYVFFKPSSQRAITYMGLPAIDGRTIATDERYFPKGALGFLNFRKPITPSTDNGIRPETQRVGRFVMDQDAGGVIKGGGRVDLFYGRGKEAKPYAVAVKDYGSLYYLAPKRELPIH